jgi:hypothetical protein
VGSWDDTRDWIDVPISTGDMATGQAVRVSIGTSVTAADGNSHVGISRGIRADQAIDSVLQRLFELLFIGKVGRNCLNMDQLGRL